LFIKQAKDKSEKGSGKTVTNFLSLQ